MITLTERAVRELKRILIDQSLSEDTFVRVGVKGGGCSGFSYTLGFDDCMSEIDQTFDEQEVKVVCDPKSFLYLVGIQIDFEESLMGRGFKFINPNASNSCGCGESFSV